MKHTTLSALQAGVVLVPGYGPAVATLINPDVRAQSRFAHHLNNWQNGQQDERTRLWLESQLGRALSNHDGVDERTQLLALADSHGLRRSKLHKWEIHYQNRAPGSRTGL